ncbi:MAG: dTDP-4-dehydrorhamnose 3,5-epimerase family protein [Mariprofundales bacterium]
MMKVFPTPLLGAAEIKCSTIDDDRGWFSRFFCQKELYELNGGREIQQVNSSFTIKRGTIRGLHFQYPPCTEDKIIRCISGRVFDVMVDLRKGSLTLGQWHGVILDSALMNMVYIPRGFAHGFQTLEENCQMLYLHTEFYNNKCDGAFSYDSPMLNIKWPIEITHVSERDKKLSCLDQSFAGITI